MELAPSQPSSDGQLLTGLLLQGDVNWDSTHTLADYNKGSIIDIAPRLYLILSFGGNDRNWLLYFSSGSSPVFLVITKSSV